MTFEEWFENQHFYWNEISEEDIKFAFKGGWNASADMFDTFKYNEVYDD